MAQPRISPSQLTRPISPPRVMPIAITTTARTEQLPIIPAHQPIALPLPARFAPPSRPAETPRPHRAEERPALSTRAVAVIAAVSGFLGGLVAVAYSIWVTRA